MCGCIHATVERLKAAEAEGGALRYKFVIDRATGKCKCSLEVVDRADPLFRHKTNENLVAFETSRYETSPLIVKGAAAGPDLVKIKSSRDKDKVEEMLVMCMSSSMVIARTRLFLGNLMPGTAPVSHSTLESRQRRFTPTIY